MSRKGQSITLSVSDQDKAQLEELASQLGVLRGERGNISGLVEAIARQKFLVIPKLSQRQVEALQQAMYALADTEQTEEAHVVATLLLERSDLLPPLKREIEDFLGGTRPKSWRLEIDRYILRQQPFQLSYQDAASRLWTFTIRHAQIVLHERRQYLDCWCDETEGNQDLFELNHNWCLRLDRISEASISSIGSEWRPNLDQIEVELHLFQGLAFAYQPKEHDTINEWLVDSPQVRRVVRLVSSTFWFFREIFRYGEDCTIVSPENVRACFKQKVQALCDRYNIKV